MMGRKMIAVIGENIVDLLMQQDGSFTAHLGGSPFNLAIGLGKLEIPCSYLNPLSQDRFGHLFANYLHTHHVLHNSEHHSHLPSSIALVAVDQLGHPHYSIYRQGVADRDFDSQQLFTAIPEGTRILHTGSLALEPQDLPKLMNIIHKAKAKNIKISVDINVRSQFVSDQKAYINGLVSLIPLCDYLKASNEDLAELYPQLTHEEAVNNILEIMGNGLLAYTLGDKGAQVITRTQRATAKVVPPTILGDTVGAGDTFYSAILSYIYEHNLDQITPQQLDAKHLDTMLLNATTAASINVSRIGCVPPTRAELQAALSAKHTQ
jgi:fructokinase